MGLPGASNVQPTPCLGLEQVVNTSLWQLVSLRLNPTPAQLPKPRMQKRLETGLE